MDIRKNPPQYKPRRTKGTPAHSFTRNVALGILAIGFSFCTAQFFLPAAKRFCDLIEQGYFKSEKKLSGIGLVSPVKRTDTLLEILEHDEDMKTRY